MFYSDLVFNSNTLLVISTIMVVLVYEKIYAIRYDFWEETRIIIKSIVFSFIFIFIIYNILFSIQDFYLPYFGFIIVFLPVFKRITKDTIFKMPRLKERVKIVGNKKQSKLLENEFKQNWYLGLKVVKKRPRSIYIASYGIDKHVLNRYIRTYSPYIRNIYVIPYLQNINFAQSQIVELFNIKTSLIKIENNLLKPSNIVLKSIFEKSLMLIVLPFLLVFHLIVSVLIKKDSKGSIFFKQERLGKDNKVFICYKYRTMYENENNLLEKYLKENPEEIELYNIYHKYTDDPRVTKLGKILRATSIDELPQIFNILKGDMSLIGPRPYMLEEYHKLKDSAKIILRVKPGISGLWQVSGRNELTFEERKTMDIWYIQNWSLWVDIVILIKTLKVVFLKVGAR